MKDIRERGSPRVNLTEGEIHPRRVNLTMSSDFHPHNLPTRQNRRTNEASLFSLSKHQNTLLSYDTPTSLSPSHPLLPPPLPIILCSSFYTLHPNPFDLSHTLLIFHSHSYIISYSYIHPSPSLSSILQLFLSQLQTANLLPFPQFQPNHHPPYHSHILTYLSKLEFKSTLRSRNRNY